MRRGGNLGADPDSAFESSLGGPHAKWWSKKRQRQFALSKIVPAASFVLLRPIAIRRPSGGWSSIAVETSRREKVPGQFGLAKIVPSTILN